IAKLHGVDPDQVLAAKGSNEVLQALCLAFGGPGRTAAVFEPTYALHSHIARITGTAVAVGERRADFTVDPEEVRRVLAEASPAIIFLCTPNNPTGLVEPREMVEAVLDAAPGLVVVDEAYAQFAPWSALSLLADTSHGVRARSRPLAVTRTYSKTWSMAAMRLGYLVAPAAVVEACERVLLPYHLDAAAQIAGRLALHWHAEMESRVAAVVRERERVTAALARLPVDVWPSGANFILFRPRSLDGLEVWKGLVERSVLVRDCSSWPRLEGCLRVTIGTPQEDDAFLAALTEVLL
ncbi:MAG: aminotransferase class I/II-fold pyridoxal phosphate-dependent enzyme, partial [Actinomycetota bacterium]|nr:aminotransferase class I/II-fold pyridoxal phosphate-dependent enzyme [Actinomycetota bacterium]